MLFPDCDDAVREPGPVPSYLCVCEFGSPTRARRTSADATSALVAKIAEAALQFGCAAATWPLILPAYMQRSVQLPNAPLIGYLHLCQKIAEAVHPINAQPKGIECVWAKSVPPGVPHALSHADRETLTDLLPNLPLLEGPPSEAEAAAFIEAYSKLEGRPDWTPCLMTKEMLDERLGETIRERRKTVDSHVQALRADHRAGRLCPVGTNHAPARAVELGARLTLADAKAYLTRVGLLYSEDAAETGAQRKAGTGFTAAGEAAKLKPGDKEKIVRRHADLKRKGAKNPTAQLAQEFSVSDRRIRAVLAEEKRGSPAFPFGRLKGR